MTDEITRALQHHVAKDEPKSVEERVDDLAEAYEATAKLHSRMFNELIDRIERLEGELSKAQQVPFLAADDGDMAVYSAKPGKWVHIPVVVSSDCDEEKE